MSRTRISYTLVEKYSELCRIADEISQESIIGVDLEADGMFHYQEKVCFLQISTQNSNILIDVLALENISPLLSVFSDPKIRKVFHGCDYDIRSLYRDFGAEVNSIFDTQIGARFLGTSQTGLANLLMDRFNITVEKKYQKRDWSRRPLSPNMLAYAIQDSCHLIHLSRMLEKELKGKGRIKWVEEECEILSNVRPASNNNEPLYLKFKGAGKLDPRSLAMLDSLLILREDIARLRDKPPFKVLGNNQILEIVNNKPIILNDLKGLSHGQIKKMGKSILKRVRYAMEISEDELPVFPKRTSTPLDMKVSRRIKALKDWRTKVSENLGLDMSLICANAQIQAIAITRPTAPDELSGVDGLRSWQKEEFGQEICKLLKAVG